MNDTVEILREYKRLLDNEIITQEEFDMLKKDFLSTRDNIVARNTQTDQQEANTTQIPQSPPHVQEGQPSSTQTEQDTGSVGWAVLGAVLPLVGLILFLVWQSPRPKDSKMAGWGALIGVGICIVCYLAVGCMEEGYYY